MKLRVGGIRLLLLLAFRSLRLLRGEPQLRPSTLVRFCASRFDSAAAAGPIAGCGRRRRRSV